MFFSSMPPPSLSRRIATTRSTCSEVSGGAFSASLSPAFVSAAMTSNDAGVPQVEDAIEGDRDSVAFFLSTTVVMSQRLLDRSFDRQSNVTRLGFARCLKRRSASPKSASGHRGRIKVFRISSIP